MPEAQIAQAVQLLDLMLEHFAEDRHWTCRRQALDARPL